MAGLDFTIPSLEIAVGRSSTSPEEKRKALKLAMQRIAEAIQILDTVQFAIPAAHAQLAHDQCENEMNLLGN
jgi:hypothetical protein